MISADAFTALLPMALGSTALTLPMVRPRLSAVLGGPPGLADPSGA